MTTLIIVRATGNRLSDLREKEKWAKHMIELLTPEYSCVLCCPNAEVKDAWSTDFTRRINEAIPAGCDDLDVRTGEHHYQGSKGHYIGQWKRGKVRAGPCPTVGVVFANAL